MMKVILFMKYELYMIYDTQAEFFDKPLFMFETKGQASGIFIDWINDPETRYYKHGDRFNLYHFGSLDNCSGKFELLDSPVIQLKGFEVKKTADVVPMKADIRN